MASVYKIPFRIREKTATIIPTATTIIIITLQYGKPQLGKLDAKNQKDPPRKTAQ